MLVPVFQTIVVLCMALGLSVSVSTECTHGMELHPSVSAIGADGDGDVGIAESAPQVELRFEPWRPELPAGISLVVPGGGLFNNGFPALSADGTRIAIFCHAPHPMEEAYPTLDIYSTSNLKLQQRIEFFSENEQSQLPDLKEAQVMARVGNRVQDTDRYLKEGGFRSVEKWFEYGGYSARPHAFPSNKFGKRIILGTEQEPNTLLIGSTSDDRYELRIGMPHFIIEYENNCGGHGLPEAGWYSLVAMVFILRVTFIGARDGCEQPEQWLLRRL